MVDALSPLDKRARDLLSALQGEVELSDVFAPVFLSAVPEAQFEAMIKGIVQQFGKPVAVESVERIDPQSANVRLRFERAIVTAAMVVTPGEPHLIAGLRIVDMQPLNDSAGNLRSELEALPGEVSVLLAPLGGGEPLLSLDPQRELAIGSTFKLYILSALARQIAQGERSWSDVVTLSNRSWPSGQMQEWPAGSPVTLHTLATMMISISDNTATDQLLSIVGREAVEAELRASGHANPDRSIPFLSTLELFGFKTDLARGTAYARASEAEQRRLLDAYAAELAGNRDNASIPNLSEPTAIDTLEWFASAEDLTKLLGRIQALDDPTARQIMAVNAVVPPSSDRNLSYVGYKGGSEPGVINMSFLLQDGDGAWYTLSMGWNNTEAPVDNSQFKALAERAIALLRR